MIESPAVLLRRTADLIRQRAEAASPGVWHHLCMGSEGCSVINDGRLRDRKHVAFCGRKEWKADHADAEHITSWHPLVALAVAEVLEQALADADEYLTADRPEGDLEWFCGQCDGMLDRDCHLDPALKLARLYLGEMTGMGIDHG